VAVVAWVCVLFMPVSGVSLNVWFIINLNLFMDHRSRTNVFYSLPSHNHTTNFLKTWGFHYYGSKKLFWHLMLKGQWTLSLYSSRVRCLVMPT
jgi:hypothetical protein